MLAVATEWREASLPLATRVPRDKVRATLPEVQYRQGSIPLSDTTHGCRSHPLAGACLADPCVYTSDEATSPGVGQDQ
jgi:hypothetical protein